MWTKKYLSYTQTLLAGNRTAEAPLRTALLERQGKPHSHRTPDNMTKTKQASNGREGLLITGLVKAETVLILTLSSQHHYVPHHLPFCIWVASL